MRWAGRGGGAVRSRSAAFRSSTTQPLPTAQRIGLKEMTSVATSRPSTLPWRSSGGGTLRVRDSTPWAAERTVLGLEVGDDVVVTADGYERLAAAYFAALERAFLEPHD